MTISYLNLGCIFNTLDFSCIWATDAVIEPVRGDQTYALIVDFSSSFGRTIYLYGVQGTSFSTQLIEHQTILTTGVWYHVALQRRSGTVCPIYRRCACTRVCAGKIQLKKQTHVR
jgi:hypothetical protein